MSACRGEEGFMDDSKGQVGFSRLRGGGVTSKLILRTSEGKEVSGSGNSDENIGRRVVRDEAS